MIEKLEIQGFKCFKQFEIAGLQRINLIAGKNSVGKSALLEAIRLHQHPEVDCILDVLHWRDGLQPDLAFWNREMVNQLFYRPGSDDAPSQILIKGNHKAQFKIARHRENPDHTWSREEVSDAWDVTDINVREVLRLDADFTGLAAGRTIIPLDGTSPIRKPPHGSWRAERALLRYANENKNPVIYVRSDALDSDSMSEMFEQIVATEVEDLVNDMMKWVVPDTERLLTKGTANQRTIYLKLRGARTLQPLRLFGEGAVRIVALGLALANTRNGCCLIDEIENGIHFELLDNVWESLSVMSRKFDVQLFVTTHSKDCVEAFQRTYRRSDFDACFYRLERAGEDINPVRLDNDSFFSIVGGQPYEVR